MLDAARAAMKLPDTSLDPHGPVAFWGYASEGQASLFLTGPLKTIDDVEHTMEWVDWFGYAGDLGVSERCVSAGLGCWLWEVVGVIRAVSGSRVTGRLPCAATGPSAARRPPRHRRGPGPTEHGAGHCVRPEGVLFGGRQDAGGGHRVGRVRVHRLATAAAARGDSGAHRGRRGGAVSRTIKRRLASVTGLFEYLDRSGCCREKPGAAWIVHAQPETGAGEAALDGACRQPRLGRPRCAPRGPRRGCRCEAEMNTNTSDSVTSTGVLPTTEGHLAGRTPWPAPCSVGPGQRPCRGGRRAADGPVAAHGNRPVSA